MDFIERNALPTWAELSTQRCEMSTPSPPPGMPMATDDAYFDAYRRMCLLDCL